MPEYTQEQLDAMFADRAKRAGESAVAGVLKDLGVDKIDDLKTTLADARRLKESQQSELDRTKAEAANLKTQLDKEKSDAQAKLDAAKAQNEKLLKRQAFADSAKTLKLTFPTPQAESDAFALADLAKVTIEGEAVKGMDDVLKDLQKNRPHLFASAKPGNLDSGARGGHGEIPIDEITKRKRAEYGARL